MRDPFGRERARARLSWAKARAAFASGILAMFLAACQGASTALPTVSATATTASPTRQVPVPTSSAEASDVPGASSAPKRQESIAVGDDERLVDLFVPSIPPGSRAPLLLLLHASGESPFVMEQASHAGELAAREGVIVALPPARGRRWDALVSPGDPITPSLDSTYILGLIDALAAGLPIDTGRVFVAGFSIGAVMSERLGCEHADRFAAVALNAGAPWSDECSPSRPVSILVLHGTADTTFRIGLAAEVVARWRAADECRGEPVVTQLSDIATSEVSADCGGGATVQFVRYEGSSHRWLANPDATELIWSFFAAQGRS